MKRSLMVLSMMVILTACTSKFDGFDPTTSMLRVGFLHMIPETDRAYIAGLFDGEGSIYYKKVKEKRNTKVEVIGTLTHGVLVWK